MKKNKQFFDIVKDTNFIITCEPNTQKTFFIHHIAGVLTCTFTLKKDSACTIIFVGKPAEDLSVHCTIELQEAGAHATLIGAYYMCGNTQVTIDTQQNHRAPHTTSTLRMRKVIQDNAQSRYNGMIYIAKDAPHVDASQEDTTIVSGQAARAHSVPAIEVLNNDVLCAHGSAIGQFDKDQLLYMQSRGLSLISAEKMLRDGFFSVVLDTIKDKVIQKSAKKVLGLSNV